MAQRDNERILNFSPRVAERRQTLMELIRVGHTHVDDLSAKFEVSPSTIRRDLAQLALDGQIARIYGGAMVTGHASEAPVDERAKQSFEEKDDIARAALKKIHDDDTVILDAGTTMTRLCRYLSTTKNRLQVITCGLATARDLTASDNDNLVTLLGGTYRRLSDSVVGPSAEQMLERFTADSVFLGADSIVAEYGICEADSRQTSLKERMASRARNVYVLADSTKIGVYPFHNWAKLSLPWTLITDWRASSEQLRPFEEIPGVTVIIAKHTPSSF